MGMMVLYWEPPTPPTETDCTGFIFWQCSDTRGEVIRSKRGWKQWVTSSYLTFWLFNVRWEAEPPVQPTCVVVWLVATLTGDTGVGCWTARICCPSATLTGSVTDFWEALEVGEATDTTVTWVDRNAALTQTRSQERRINSNPCAKAASQQNRNTDSCCETPLLKQHDFRRPRLKFNSDSGSSTRLWRERQSVRDLYLETKHQAIPCWGSSEVKWRSSC